MRAGCSRAASSSARYGEPRIARRFESLKLYIYYLRRKIEHDPERPEFILTSRGVGYRFASK